MVLFSACLLAYAVSDLLCKSAKPAGIKTKTHDLLQRAGAIACHAFLFFAFAFLLLLIESASSPGDFLLPLCIITVLHCLIDIVRYFLAKEPLIDFLIDRLLRFLAVTGILILLGHPTGSQFVQLFTDLFDNSLIIARAVQINLVLACGIGLVWGSGSFISLVLKPAHTAAAEQPDTSLQSRQKRGTYIGYLERILIFFFVMTGTYSALGLIGTFKTLARFKQLDDKDFAEYYILGTLLSLTMGVIFSALIKFIWNCRTS